MEIISLGGNCSIAYQLNKLGLRKKAYPFDWCDIKINQLITVLNEDFKDFEEISIIKKSERHFLIEDKEEEKEPTYIIKNKYNVRMAHEMIREEDIEEMKERIRRRIERFREIREAIFVRVETRKEDRKKYDEMIRWIDGRYEKYRIIVVSMGESPELEWMTEERRGWIKWVKIEGYNEDWKREDLEWEKIFM
jgi:hypothetical protein